MSKHWDIYDVLKKGIDYKFMVWEESSADDFARAVRTNKLNQKGWECYYGASKAVFKRKKNCKKVYKIPFSGFLDVEEGNDIPTYFPFEGAMDGIKQYRKLKYGTTIHDEYADEYEKYSNDYCYAESALYEIAKLYKVQSVFAKTRLLNTIIINDSPVSIYVQPYCSIDFTDFIDRGKWLKKHHYYTELNDAFLWNNIFVDYKKDGSDMIRKVSKFLKDTGINDLDFGNYGINRKGKLKIFDYSGYNC